MVNVKLSNENEKDEYSYLLLHFKPSLTSHMSLGCFLKVCGLIFSIPEGMMNSCTVTGADLGFFLGGVHH